ncbi:hypothetical protein RSP799_20335 [Ralstonia solanacearum]|nr:hypothetical protein RSP799_20335 [Ralstonia solanacearum]
MNEIVLRNARASEIREILGPIDEEVITRILDIEPSIEDVRLAYHRLRVDKCPACKKLSNLGGKAAEVFEILDDELPDFDSSGHPHNPG